MIVQFKFADLRRVPNPPRGLFERILLAVDLYPCHVLFIHRDAEAQSPQLRYEEIVRAGQLAAERGFDLPYICVVPVRMTEAWLLISEAAIRKAAGNPNGIVRLDLPELRRLEGIPDPKKMLYDLLKKASGRRKRDLTKFRPAIHSRLVSEYVTEFSQLRRLPAFQRLERNVREVFGGMEEGDQASH